MLVQGIDIQGGTSCMAMVVADMDAAAIFNAPKVLMNLTLLFYGIT